jgi:uncharacterized protein YbaA (DUF1428 family)
MVKKSLETVAGVSQAQIDFAKKTATVTFDADMKKMMEDPRMDPSAPGNPPMPFDGKRMIFGGFEQVVEVKA